MIELDMWQKFKIGDLFDVSISKSIDKTYLNFIDDGEIEYIGRTAVNNGIQGKMNVLDNIIPNQHNVFSLAQIGDNVCLFRETPWYSSQNIFILHPKYEKIIAVEKFVSTVITKTMLSVYGCDAYASYPTLKTLKDVTLLLPATPSGDPDWDYMESYMKEMEEKAKERLDRLEEMRKQEKKRIDVTGWGEFKVGELFGIVKMRDKLTNKDIYIDGKTPVYSSTTDNNGIVGYTDLDADYIVNEKVERLVLFGDHTKSFFIAEESFCTMDNVKVLIPKNFNKYCIRYILTVWKAMIPDLGYSRHWNIAKNIKILLPVTSAGTPDWDYMEQYMREMEEKAKSRIEKLSVLSK